MRLSALALVISLASGGWAQTSFDLMYLPSSTTNRVIRYDPINRVQLGGWAANGASSILYNGGPRGIVRLAAGNYRTNMYSGINEMPFGSAQISSLSADGEATHTFTSGNFIANGLISGIATIVALSGSAIPFAGTRLTNNSIIGFAQQGMNLNVLSFNSAGTLISSLTVFANQTRTTNSAVIITQDNLGGTWIRTMVRTSGSQHALLSAQFNPSTGALTGATSGTFQTGFSSVHGVSLARAHMGFYMVGSDATTNTLTRFTSLDSQTTPIITDTWTESFDTRSTANVYSVGMVVAPEPGTMIGLGLGAVALLRRRNASKTRA